MSRFGSRRIPALMRRRSGVVAGGGVELLTTDLLVQHEAAAANVTLSGSEVTNWADLSAAGNDAAQSDATERPEYEAAGGPGSTPCLAFGAQSTDTNGHLTYASALKASAGPVTLYFVCNPATNPTNSALFDAQSGRILLMASRLGDVAFFDGTYRQIAAGTTGWQVLTYRLNASTGEIFRGRTSLGTGTWTTNVAIGGTIALGSGFTGGTPFDGRMSGVYIYGADHDADQRAAVWDYIASIWTGVGV